MGICCCVYKGGSPTEAAVTKETNIVQLPLKFSVHDPEVDELEDSALWSERSLRIKCDQQKAGGERLGPEMRQAWAAHAARWRFLLRTSQSLVATCLYGVSTFARWPSRPVPLQFLIAVLVAPVFVLLYHELSMNQAGSYYSSFLQMFTQLPRLFLNLGRRDSDAYRKEMERERCEGIVRTVNGLESGVIFLVVNSVTLGASAALSIPSLAGEIRWRFLETAFLFMLHRALGANVFEGRYGGLLQPESMWRFEREPQSSECRIRPLLAHPQPSY